MAPKSHERCMASDGDCLKILVFAEHFLKWDAKKTKTDESHAVRGSHNILNSF